eukprot:3066063-Rhodomonas_salina.7
MAGTDLAYGPFTAAPLGLLLRLPPPYHPLCRYGTSWFCALSRMVLCNVCMELAYSATLFQY